MAAPEGPPCIVVVDRDPGVATSLTRELERLGGPAAEALVGSGVFYGSALTEAPALGGEHAVVVGGDNSAGQAAAHLSHLARQVTLVARGRSLTEWMSCYLIDELASL